jgi:hypothetical protein
VISGVLYNKEKKEAEIADSLLPSVVLVLFVVGLGEEADTLE